MAVAVTAFGIEIEGGGKDNGILVVAAQVGPKQDRSVLKQLLGVDVSGAVLGARLECLL